MADHTTALERCERRTVEVIRNDRGDVLRIPGWCSGELAVICRQIAGMEAWSIVYRSHYILGGTIFRDAETASAAMLELAAGSFNNFTTMTKQQIETATKIVGRNNGILLRLTVRLLEEARDGASNA